MKAIHIMAKKWWGTDEEISMRLKLEIELMQRTFGNTFSLERDGDILAWLGNVEVNLKGIPQREHKLKIIYSPDYPRSAPDAYVISPKLEKSELQHDDGSLFLFDYDDGIEHGWNPSKSTAVTVISWAIEWLYIYYVWKENPSLLD